MGMDYSKLFKLLKEHGYTTYKIRKEGLIGQATLKKLQNNTGIIDTRTIENICHALHCQPGDIMEYIEVAQAAEEEQ